MKNQSFSATVKEHLSALPIKKKCCQRAYDDGCGIFSGTSSPDVLIKKGADGLVCNDCLSHFIAGIFMSSGSLSDPNKIYHLDFSFPDSASAEAASTVLASAGFNTGCNTRKGRYILYLKNSAHIEDLLGYIGASFGAFEVMNAKIVRELRENTNRQVNCDAANIAKSVGAAEKHIKLINELIEKGSFSVLPAELKETAELRIKYPNATLAELGQLFIKPVSKSGVKHRLDKITDFYESEKQKWNNTKSEE